MTLRLNALLKLGLIRAYAVQNNIYTVTYVFGIRKRYLVLEAL